MTAPNIIHGDCIEQMRNMPDNSVDSIVTDPPYGLGFMGKKWDALPPGEEWAIECLRVLKPGGHVLAFGGTRTWHRLAVAIEDAGFEIRDSLYWLYGSGFPKSHDVGKSTGDPKWSGWGTALKPATEPIVMARKPFPGTVAANVQTWGTGAINIDGSRIGAGDPRPLRISKSEDSTGILGDGLNGSYASGETNMGRWPANVVLDETTAPLLDRQSGRAGAHGSNRGTGLMRGDIGPVGLKERSATTPPNDEGGASRFFYVAKAPKRERPVVDGVAHPTVKPLALMRWLVKLVTPPGGTVLEPFAGSGATVEACMLEGFNVIAIEQEADYIPLIQARIDRAA
jgi:site-specific DNA-methyltransferase (adenine-specific)